MARPNKQPHEKRTERFNLRYTQAEIEHVRAQAHAAGLDPHDYARRRTLNHSVPPAPSRPGVDAALISELNKIGNNVNQLARAVHRGRQQPGEWTALAAELRTVLTKLASDDGS